MHADRKGFDSICVNDKNVYDHQSHTQAIYASSTFAYESADKAMEVFRGNEEALIYSRWSHPNAEMIEIKLAKLESFDLPGVEVAALAFSSGLAAISAVFHACAKTGDCIIAQGNIYGSSVELLDKILVPQGIKVKYVDMHDLAAVKTLADQEKNVVLFYAETPSNPTLSVYDLKAIADLAHSYGAKLAVDNTFATPYLQRPLNMGADIVIHSGTKYINGHGTALGGIVIASDKKWVKETLWLQRKLNGAMISPFDAWLMNNGLKTLSLRMEKHCSNAMQVAQFLEASPLVAKVNYPGLPSHPHHALAKAQMLLPGGVLSFELKGGMEAGIAMIKKVKLCTLTASIGTPDTLIQHPASMTHYNMPAEQRAKFGITDGLIRLSVGLENVEDIMADLEQAFA
jgi:methionine-gamma-lyase